MAVLSQATVQLVDPTGADPGKHSLSLAPRPADLRGKRLGLLDNSKANSEIILRAIARLLDERFGFADIFYTRKHSASLPPHPEVMADLHRHTDVVITGIGD
ncbi:MAG: hypothetical protein ACE5HC_06880 [Candidatus Binatia bacterium]